MKKAVLQFLFISVVLYGSQIENHADFLKKVGLTGRINPQFRSLSVPQGNFYTAAEFDTAEGVILCYNQSTEDLQLAMTAFIAEDTLVYFCCENQADMKGKMEQKGINLANVRFLTGNYFIWVRDWGAQWVVHDDGTSEKILVDYMGEDCALALYNQLPGGLHIMAFSEAGGNQMFDGHGTAFSSWYEEYPFSESEEEIRNVYRDFYNVEQLVFLKPLKKEMTGHIDLYCKLLGYNLLLLGEYRNDADAVQGNREILEENCKTLAEVRDLAGKKYRIERIVMPQYKESQFQGYVTTLSYVNSLIVNRKILVPVYNIPTDEEALETYRRLMPGYTVKGFDCSKIIEGGGAIHCITNNVYSGNTAMINELERLSVRATGL
ncbi:MAG: agmatine deiminase family protein [Candidatus Wallbacteria bacterium]|nr:agmatine deiminase family protein [Candidatus Wallbacteria bacterium]